MLGVRVITAVVGIPLFLVLLFAPGGGWFSGFVCLLTLIGLWEYWSAHNTGLRPQGIHPNAIATFLGIVFPLSVWISPYTWFEAIWLPPIPNWSGVLEIQRNNDFLAWVADLSRSLTLGLLLAFIWEVRHCWRVGILPVAQNLGVGLLGAFYVGWLFSFVVELRLETGASYLLDFQVDRGAALLLWLMVTLWVGDSAAYFVGRLMGKRKLAPLLSPGKTVEGAIANCLGCLLVSSGMAVWLGFPELQGVLVGFGAGVFGQFGDLFKSALKRSLGIKDFGQILPGHGGVLDRFDSLLFAAPWMWVIIQWGVGR